MKKIVRTLAASKLQLHLARASVNGDKHANSADRLALELRAADVLGGDANGRGHCKRRRWERMPCGERRMKRLRADTRKAADVARSRYVSCEI